MNYHTKDLPSPGPAPLSLSFRCSDFGAESFEDASEAVSISLQGFVMRCHRRLTLGSTLMLLLRVPTRISGSPFRIAHCRGRVVSEQTLEDGTLAYEVEVERAAAVR